MDKNGGIIGPINTPTTSAASGIWRMNEVYDANVNVIWPIDIIAPSLIDEFDSATQDYQSTFYGATLIGNSFSNPDAADLTTAEGHLIKVGSPTGSVYAELYAHTGTYGSGTGTGSVLATSDAVDVTTVGATSSWVEFTFSTEYSMSASTYYVIVFHYTGGDASNYLQCSLDSSTPTHSGCTARYAGSWSGYTAYDACFKVYGRVT